MKHVHHIIPRYAGGTNTPENLVELTVEEHAEAHRILWETHGDLRDKMAWLMLSGKTEEAESLRIELARQGYNKFLADAQRTDKWKSRISESLKGHTQSVETRRKRSDSLKKAYREGRKQHTLTKEISALGGRSGKKQAAAARRVSKKWHASVRSPETRLKKSLSSPKKVSITIDGVVYHSLRHAAKELNVPYSRIRALYHDTTL